MVACPHEPTDITDLQDDELGWLQRGVEAPRILTIWFDPEMNWDAKPSGKSGRSQTFSDAAVQTCVSVVSYPAD